MNILLPRPAPHLARTEAALRRAGFTQVHSLAIADYHHLPLPAFPTDITALLLTSAAALTTFLDSLKRTVGKPDDTLLPRAGCLRFLPTWCVGRATAAAARKAGLNVVYAGSSQRSGDAAALASHILGQTLPAQHFFHLHAHNAKTEWHATLRRGNHRVTALNAYETAYIHSLAAEHGQRLRQNPPTHTLLFSPAAARHLRRLMEQANIRPTGTAVAFSAAVAAQARGAWPRVVVARRPTLPQLLNALKTETQKES